jgi:trehalose 6-phosphate synthase
LARVIIVSNRVAIPRGAGAQRAGGLEVALEPILKEVPSVWFGWSGNVVEAGKVTTQTVERANTTYVVTDLSEEEYQEYYNGFANRVLWPVLPLPHRLDRVQPPRSYRLFPREPALRRRAVEDRPA